MLWMGNLTASGNQILLNNFLSSSPFVWFMYLLYSLSEWSFLPLQGGSYCDLTAHLHFIHHPLFILQTSQVSWWTLPAETHHLNSWSRDDNHVFSPQQDPLSSVSTQAVLLGLGNTPTQNSRLVSGLSAACDLTLWGGHHAAYVARGTIIVKGVKSQNVTSFGLGKY